MNRRQFTLKSMAGAAILSLAGTSLLTAAPAVAKTENDYKYWIFYRSRYTQQIESALLTFSTGDYMKPILDQLDEANNMDRYSHEEQMKKWREIIQVIPIWEADGTRHQIMNDQTFIWWNRPGYSEQHLKNVKNFAHYTIKKWEHLAKGGTMTEFLNKSIDEQTTI